MQASHRTGTSSGSSNSFPASHTWTDSHSAIHQAGPHDQALDTCSVDVPMSTVQSMPGDGSSYAELYIKHSSSSPSSVSPSSVNSNTDQTPVSTPSVTGPPSTSPYNKHRAMSSTSSSTHAVQPGLSGVRKKNAKIDIPPEHTIEVLEQLIRECDNPQELAELRKHKRVLTNRQAALRSRQGRKARMELLERENNEFRITLQHYEQSNRRLHKANLLLQSQLTNSQSEKANLEAEVAHLRAQLGIATTLTPRHTPVTSAAQVSYVDHANNGLPMFPQVPTHEPFPAVPTHQPFPPVPSHDITMSTEEQLRSSYHASYGTINPQHITTAVTSYDVAHRFAELEDPSTHDF